MQRSLIVLLMILLITSMNLNAQDVPAETTEDPSVGTISTPTPEPQPTEAPITSTPEETAVVLPTVAPTAEPTIMPEETQLAEPEATEITLPEPTATTEIGQIPQILLPAESLVAVADVEMMFAIRVMDDAAGMQLDVQALSGGTLTWDVQALSSEADLAVTVTYRSSTAPLVDNVLIRVTDADGLIAEALLIISVEIAEVATETPAVVSYVERVINYDVNATEAAITAMLQALGAQEIARIPQIGAMRVLLPDFTATTSAARAQINAQTGSSIASAMVLNVEPIVERQLDLTPNDPIYGSQWGLMGGAGGAYVNFAWDIAPRKGTGVIVAVLDTGIDLQHPDLAGQILPGWDFSNDDAIADDDHGHGTHVAGVIAARTNNLIGISGIAYTAKLLPVKVLDYNGFGGTFDIAAGIIYAVDRGARVINMSLGGGTYSTTEYAAIQYALSRNVVVIAAAGNSGGTDYSYPASYSGVISVAAHDSTGTLASFSTRNDRVTISAPGVSIYSTVPIEIYGVYYTIMSGTSMATPHVAGVAALILANSIATTPAGVREALICSALDAGTVGYDNSYGYGLMQADWALNWRSNSGTCKVVQLNDVFEAATRITTLPYSVSQPVHTRSVTTNIADPEVCGVNPNQTLWYTYTPTVSATYQITTFGSSYDTVVGVYQGSAGALRQLTCNNDSSISGHATQSHLGVELTAGRLYYIMVSAIGAVDDGVLKLDVRPTLALVNRLQQENMTFVQYMGGWQRSLVRAASGGVIMETNSNEALAAFMIRGNRLDLGRIVGPDQGEIEVWVDGVLHTTLSGRAAVARTQVVMVSLPGNAGAWHQIVLRRSSSGAAGNISVDTITVQDATIRSAIFGMGDDRDARIEYVGTWDRVILAGAYLNTVSSTTTSGNRLRVRMIGNTIIISRATSPGFGSMTVYVDGILHSTVSNESSTGNSVPYVITGLNPVEHLVEIVNTGTQLTIDSIRSLNVGIMSTVKTDNTSSLLLYSNQWAREINGLAYLSSVHDTADPTAAVSFYMRANQLCLGYSQQPGGGNMNVSINGEPYATIATANALTSFPQPWCSGVIPNDVHYVEIEVSGGPVELDYVFPKLYNTITPARRVVQENDPAMTYSGMWYTLPGFRSAGGFLGQGSTLRYTETDGASVRFFINGTGLIIYTSMGPSAGEIEVFVDGVQQDIVLWNNTYSSLDLYDPRTRPYAYAIADLPPGIHEITLRAKINNGIGQWYVDFDAVRVFP